MDSEIRSALLRVVPFSVILVVIVIRLYFKKLNPDELFIRKPNLFLRFIICIIGFLVYVLLVELVLYKFDVLEIKKWNHPLASSIIRIFGVVILAPISEELIFRGILLNKLNQKFKIHLAVFIQAIIFVLLHNFTYKNNLSSKIGIAQSFVDASLFAYARQYTKSIYTPMAMHMTGNLIATVERFIF